LKGPKPKEASVGFAGNTVGSGRNLSGVPSPEEGSRVFGPEANFEREAAFERTYGTREGVKPRRVNPMSGTGMK
jgi:hypothetical protein